MKNQIIATNKQVDFWYINGEVYRSNYGAVLDTNGLPQDARWECSYDHFKLYRDTVFSWVDDTDVSCETIVLKKDLSNWLPGK